MTRPAVRPSGLLLALALAAGCSSAPSTLYHEGEPPRLKDGTVTLRTRWLGSKDTEPDVRRVACRDGMVTAEWVSRTRGRHRGTVPVADWESLWRKLLELKPFTSSPRFDVQEHDARAPGPYHLVSLELDGRFHEFSAQLRQNILGVFKTGDVDERLRYTNAVQELVDAHALVPVEQEPVEAPPGAEGEGRR